jgi:hypothetical protein
MPPSDPARALSALSRYVATDNLEQSEHRSVGGDGMLLFRRHWHFIGRRASQT